MWCGGGGGGGSRYARWSMYLYNCYTDVVTVCYEEMLLVVDEEFGRVLSWHLSLAFPSNATHIGKLSLV